MRRPLSVAVAGLVAALAVSAQGVAPRNSSSDYPVNKEAHSATIAAAVVPPDTVKKLFPGDVAKHYVVMEVAVYPLPGQNAYIDAFDFDLKYNADEVSYPRSPEEIVSIWAEKSAPQPPGKVGVTTETGVVYTSGRDPETGRRSGWGTYSDVAVGPTPPTPPQPLSADPQAVEERLRANALPMGTAVRPVAGYLYFAIPAKKHKAGAMELQYIKDGAMVSLPIQAK